MGRVGTRRSCNSDFRIDGPIFRPRPTITSTSRGFYKGILDFTTVKIELKKVERWYINDVKSL
jgi:hypothetical protein